MPRGPGRLLLLAMAAACATAGGPRPAHGEAAQAPGAALGPAEAATRLQQALAPRSPEVRGEPLRERSALVRFYSARAWRPAWTDRSTQDAPALLRAVRRAGDHGLSPERYHAAALAAVVEADPPAAGAAPTEIQRDLLLSDAFLHLARHLAAGAVDPRSLHPRYTRGDEPPDPVAALDAALRAGDVAGALAGLAPPRAEYAGLRAALARLRAEAAAGDWPGVEPGGLVKPGERSPRIPALRARLAWPAPPPPARDPELLDPALAGALRAFQVRHGLRPDAILGPDTVAALAVSIAERLDQLRANLERWRWQPRELGARSVHVNVAGFGLRAWESGESPLAMRVVVGCRGWRTPLLHAEITHLELNPAWEVPRSIAVREMLPRARRNPDYFASNGLEVYLAKDGRRPVNAAAVDWRSVDAADFPYRVRQPPGPRNPLGRIKFIFPNPFGVYLHGTPGRASLERDMRALSHGCVRVEDELALAAWILAPDPAWTRDGLVAALATARERRIPLSAPLPLHLLYLTAEARDDDAPSFYADPYGWDARLVAALRAAGHASDAPSPP